VSSGAQAPGKVAAKKELREAKAEERQQRSIDAMQAAMERKQDRSRIA